MKKVLFLMSFFLFIGMTANAQAKKACCASKAKSSCSKKAEMKADADVKVIENSALAAAESMDDIEVRTCPMSGQNSFYQKVSNESGKTDWVKVEFNQEEGTFTRVASASAEKEVVKEMTKEEKKACKKKCDKSKCSKAEKKACSKKCSKTCDKKGTSSAMLEKAPEKVKVSVN